MSITEYILNQEFETVARTPLESSRLWAIPCSAEEFDYRAKAIAYEIGMDEEDLPPSAYTARLYEHYDATRIHTHTRNQSLDLIIFNNKAIIILETDFLNESALQTVHSPNGDIEYLTAKGNFRAIDHDIKFQRIHKKTGTPEEFAKNWEKYQRAFNFADRTFTVGRRKIDPPQSPS